MELMFMLLAGRRMGVCGGIMSPLTGVIGLRERENSVLALLMDHFVLDCKPIGTSACLVMTGVTGLVRL